MWGVSDWKEAPRSLFLVLGAPVHSLCENSLTFTLIIGAFVSMYTLIQS